MCLYVAIAHVLLHKLSNEEIKVQSQFQSSLNFPVMHVRAYWQDINLMESLFV